MKKNEAKKIIEETFSSKFDKRRFHNFIANLLKKYTHVEKTREGQFIKESFKSFVLKYKIVGYFDGSEGSKIDILEVSLNKKSTLERARTAQRNFVAQYLKDNNKEAALVAFISPNNKDWRLSLVRLESSLEVVGDKLKTREEITPAKRWSFLVGENEGSHTAQSRFINLLVSDECPSLKELELAFDIERVTKEFFDKYKELFLKLKEQLDKLLETDEKIKKDFLEKEISTVDFAKKTLGQIVFLYFLQKKGWFGVKEDESWGSGNKKFMRRLFDWRKEFSDYKGNFFNDILEPLFYEGLSSDLGNDNIYDRLSFNGQKYKMPFLNGGLFSPMNEYLWKTTDIVIPDALFSNDNKPKEGDIGDGILDVFDRYNFTVNENEPLEKEVAVDPEMLGKVFENLLNTKDRKSSGAFYTPREIVHYMCQESLINYLKTKNRNEISREDLELFIKKGDRIIENDKITLEKIKEKKDKGYEYKGDYKLLLPDLIISKAKELDKLLQSIKVADPAVGSGAFPLGMINEIVRARKVLNIYLNENISDYKLKKYTITHSIYGVDIDPGAVDIAKLRLWLALVVDEDTPHPLPNLEHKIMQGNSLISEYEGIKLFDESLFPKVKKNDLEKEFLIKEIKKLKSEYREKVDEGKTLNQLKNSELSKNLRNLRRKIKKIEDEPVDTVLTMSLFDNPEESVLEIINKKTESLSALNKEFISESQKTKKQELKKEIDELKWDIIEMTLQQQGRKDKLEEIKELRKKNEKPFFIWKLEFSDVFKNNRGFDVVIGNPPYIQLQKNGGYLADLLQNAGYETFVRSGDIYGLFYEHGNNILNKSGHLVFITSNKWMRAGYGEKLRNYLSQKTTPKILLDLGPGVFETATVDTNILLFQKNKSENIPCMACGIKVDLVKENIKLENYIEKNKVEIDNFSSEAWTILNPIEKKIKEKIKAIGTPLKDWDIKINRGVLTGYNEAFIIDGKKKDELIAADSKSAEIIKPILRGKDIKRYSAEFADKWLITSHNGYKKENGERIEAIDIKKYPAIKEWLDSYWENILKRGDKGKTPYNLRHCAYQEEFEKEKIVWGNIAYEASFSFDNNFIINAPANLLTSNCNVRYLLSIMNSRVFSWEFEQLGIPLGRAYEWKKQYIEKIHVPQISTEQQKPFIDLVEQILEITSAENYDSKNPPIQQKELEKKIDEMVFELYGLIKEEKEIVLKS